MIIKIGDLPQSLVDEILDTWDDHEYEDTTELGDMSVVNAEFEKVLVGFFKKQHINIKYYVVNDDQFQDDDIELNEKDLTLLRLKYT